MDKFIGCRKWQDEDVWLTEESCDGVLVPEELAVSCISRRLSIDEEGRFEMIIRHNDNSNVQILHRELDGHILTRHRYCETCSKVDSLVATSFKRSNGHRADETHHAVSG